jgi:hypothetical protein
MCLRLTMQKGGWTTSPCRKRSPGHARRDTLPTLVMRNRPASEPVALDTAAPCLGCWCLLIVSEIGVSDPSISRASSEGRRICRVFRNSCGSRLARPRRSGSPRAAGLSLRAATVLTERYRSGRTGIASKAICRESGTWVRIPPSPPTLLACGELRLASRLNSGTQRLSPLRARIPPSPPFSVWRFIEHFHKNEREHDSLCLGALARLICSAIWPVSLASLAEFHSSVPYRSSRESHFARAMGRARMAPDGKQTRHPPHIKHAIGQRRRRHQ